MDFSFTPEQLAFREQVLKFTAKELAPLADQKAMTLSGGERRRLEITRALVTNPTLILLDEPFSGVDPIAVEDLQREIRRLRQETGT